MENETSEAAAKESSCAVDDAYDSDTNTINGDSKSEDTLAAVEEDSHLKEELAATVEDSSIAGDERELLWEDELEADITSEHTSSTRQDYLSFCDLIHETLRSLLADEMTGMYANFSLLFKKFRLVYAHNQKLLGKVFELESVKRSLKGKNKNLLKKLDERDEQEKQLQNSYMTIRSAIADTVQQKNDIEKERDELKEQLAQIPEELIRAANERSLVDFVEEKRLLKAEIDDMREKLMFADEDLKHSQKREEFFRQKYNDAKSIHVTLREEIVSIRRDMMLQMQLRENAELTVSEKNATINKNISSMKRMKTEMENLEKSVEYERQMHSRIFKDMQSLKKSLTESGRIIIQLKNEASSRQFHGAILKIKKDKLERELERKNADIHALKVANENLSKERHYYARSARIFEEDCKRLKEDYEKTFQANKHYVSEIEELQKEKLLNEADYKEAIKQMEKIESEFRLSRKIIKELRSKVKVLEVKNEAAIKELEVKVREVQEVEIALEKVTAEKNGLVREVSDLSFALSQTREIGKALEQKCKEYGDKIPSLRDEIQAEKDRYRFLQDMHREMSSQFQSTKLELADIRRLNDIISKRSKNQIVQISSLQEKQDKLEKQITAFKVEVRSARSAQAQQEIRCNKLSEELNHKEKEKVVVLRSLSEMEIEICNVKREMKRLVDERGVLKVQVEEKANEMKLKEGKIRLLEQDLSKVQQEVQDRIGDVKVLKTEIENLRRSEAILKNQISGTESLRNEINNVHRELMEEKLKGKFLEEELRKPQNVHRWRILEAEDPSRAHLISRNLKFQKDLVKKTEKLKTKEQELHDKNRKVTELQQDLDKLMKVKSEGDIWSLKKELQECKERIKCLGAEIAMYENLTSKQEIENKELRNEINKLKVSAYEKKLTPIKTSST